MYRGFLKKFAVWTLVLCLLLIGAVVCFDPFFVYHRPISPLKAVLTKKEYQVPGTLRNFHYDSVIFGSSTAENFNNHWFDETFDCTSVKAIKSSGITGQLDWYMNLAFENRDLNYVFYSLDLFALLGDPDVVFPDASMPEYLYDDNPFNNVKYLLNKDVVFEDIPYMLAETFLDDYDEGTSYNWAQYKVFSKEEALLHYDRPMEAEEITEDLYAFADGNVDLLERQVKNHPETRFVFFYPPYSLLWWDNMSISGRRPYVEYAARRSMEKLLPYENVSIYSFQNEKDVILDLDRYMDPVHFTAETNHWMVKQMGEDNYRLTVDNYSDFLDSLRITVDDINSNYDTLIR